MAAATDPAPLPARTTAPSDQPISARISADQRARRRQIVENALAQFGEVDVEHHDDEQEQHRDRADIDDDQDHRQELGAEQDEQAGGVDEGEDQEQHRVHRGCAPRPPPSRRSDQQPRTGEGDQHRVSCSRRLRPRRAVRATRLAIRRVQFVTERRVIEPMRSRAPSGRRSRAASPCRTSVPRASRWRTRVRAFDDGIDRAGFLAESRNRCTSPCRCRSASCGGAVVAARPASMVMACAGQIASHSLQAMQRSSPLG